MNHEFNKSIELALADFEYDYETRCQVWSFAWYKGRVISIGKNNAKTHPLNLINQLKFSNGKIHYLKGSCAELVMFLKLKKTTRIDFSKIVICNVRLDKNKNICMAAPCDSCASLIKYIKPKKVFYTVDKDNWGEYIYY